MSWGHLILIIIALTLIFPKLTLIMFGALWLM